MDSANFILKSTVGNTYPAADISSADELNKLASPLEVSPDYLMNGTIDLKAQSSAPWSVAHHSRQPVAHKPPERKRTCLTGHIWFGSNIGNFSWPVRGQARGKDKK